MNGVININKPLGITSYDVVHKLKKICNTGKIGHTGTLDPGASGVLPVCIGKATKIVDYIMSDTKTYRAELKLGVITDTYDAEGKVLNTFNVNVSEEDVKNTIKTFVGDIEQVPPMYSAIKVNGQKLYELARKGIEVERKPRKISIYSIEIIEIALPNVIFEVKCSKGTYIRSLCYDIGNMLGCGGSMWALERISSGSFNIDNSFKLEELNKDNINDYLMSIDEALSSYEATYIDEKYEKLLLNGVTIKDTSITCNLKSEVIYRVYLSNKKFIGLGEKSSVGFNILKLLV